MRVSEPIPISVGPQSNCHLPLRRRVGLLLSWKCRLRIWRRTNLRVFSRRFFLCACSCGRLRHPLVCMRQEGVSNLKGWRPCPAWRRTGIQSLLRGNSSGKEGSGSYQKQCLGCRLRRETETVLSDLQPFNRSTKSPRGLLQCRKMPGVHQGLWTLRPMSWICHQLLEPSD